MPKWWQKARERVNARADDPDAVGLERDQAYDQAFDAFGQGDPSQAQAFIYDRAQTAAEQRAGAGHYHNMARGHAQHAQRDDVYTRPGTPNGGDPGHRAFTDVAPRPEMDGRGGYRELSDPTQAHGAHLHPEFGCVHNHAGGHIPHGHSEFAWRQAGYDPAAGQVPGPEPAAEAAATLPEALARGAMAGAVASTPLAATPLGGGGIALGGVIGALTGGGLHYRGRRRAAGGTPANPSPWSLLFPVLLAAALAVPSDHIDWEYESSFRELSPPAPATDTAGGEDDPAAVDPAAWDPVAESSRRKYGGVTADGQPCALGQDGPALCYHPRADGGPDLARGASNHLTRGGDVFGIDADGRPCLLGAAGCQPTPDGPPGPVLPGFPAGGGAFVGNAPWGPPAAPQLGRRPDGRACYVGPDNPACAPVADAELAALPPGFGAPPPAAELPPVELPAMPTLEPPAWLGDCAQDDLEQCAEFGFGPVGGIGDPFNRGGNQPPGPGGWAEGDWQGRGWNNPGNLAEFGVRIPPSHTRGCDMGGGKPCTPMSLAAFKRGIRSLGLADGGPIVLCPTLQGFRHTPDHPVLATQAEAAGLARSRTEVSLFVQTNPGFWVSWTTDRHGRLEFTAIEDPVAAVSVRKVLTPATIRWINEGEVQQRFPGKRAQVPDVCFADNLRAGEPLHAWNPVDPGVHQISEVQLMTHWGVTETLDARRGNYDPYEFEVALGVASATR